MRNTVALCALATVFATAPAQLVQDTTPKMGSEFEWKLTSDGSVLMALNAWTFHESYFAIPLGFDFSAGHGVWIGSRSNIDRLNDAQAVFGYEVYAKKDLGADWFLKGSAGLALGPRTDDHKALTGYLGLSAGKKF